jgi:hypothetical protein
MSDQAVPNNPTPSTNITTEAGTGSAQGSTGITTEAGAQAAQLAQGIQTAPIAPDSEPADAIYEATEVIANFMDEDEAQPALTALRSAGIQAVLSGAVPNPASFSLFGRMQYAPMQVAVPPEQADEARRILAHLDAPPESGWEEAAEKIEGWMCHECDTVVPEGVTVCPECGTPRAENPPEPEEDKSEDQR